MIARITKVKKFVAPIFDVKEMSNESDVEHKLVTPFLTNESYLGIPSGWVRNQDYMSPTDIDKLAGKRYGYKPDQSIWLNGLPLLVVENKEPGVTVESALREARMYASEVNKRYPPDVNPVGYVLACNGHQLGLSNADSEIGTLIVDAADIQPGSSVLDVFKSAIGKIALEERVKKLAPHFATRQLHSISSAMGGQAKLSRQLGVNEFAEPLFPVLTRYFDDSSETPDEVIDRAYVNSDELTRYEGILETYLKDRTASIGGNQLKTIETSRTSANALSGEIHKFAGKPAFFSRVQIVVGSVGAGKSTFIRRYHRHLMTKEVKAKTLWAFINFNVTGSRNDMNGFVAEHFLKSFADMNGDEFYEEATLDKILAPEMLRFERINRSLSKENPSEFAKRKADERTKLMDNNETFVGALSRYFAGERGLGLVVVFDNVDKESSERQLAIFESAQWFKELTKSLVIVNIRDVTFESHREEPPLDAFINAINFYIRPPRFAQVIRKRLELMMESLPTEVEQKQTYTLTGGQKVRYNADRLGEFVMRIYLSLFESRDMASMLESLVAKDVRRALGMFSDIIVSPHISTNQITGAVVAGEKGYRIPEWAIIRSLMRGRYQYFNGKSVYIHDIISADEGHSRPSNFIFVDVLEFLIRNRKTRLEFNQEGYASIGTLVKEMSRLGYDESDADLAIRSLIAKGMIEPESLIETDLSADEPVRAHASGYIHTRILLRQVEYLTGVTPVIKVASPDVANTIGSVWAGWDPRNEMSVSNKARILQGMHDYLRLEYQRRARRHAFYEEYGHGGRLLVQMVENASNYMQGLIGNPTERERKFVPRYGQIWHNRKP